MLVGTPPDNAASPPSRPNVSTQSQSRSRTVTRILHLTRILKPLTTAETWRCVTRPRRKNQDPKDSTRKTGASHLRNVQFKLQSARLAGGMSKRGMRVSLSFLGMLGYCDFAISLVWGSTYRTLTPTCPTCRDRQPAGDRQPAAASCAWERIPSERCLTIRKRVKVAWAYSISFRMAFRPVTQLERGHRCPTSNARMPDILLGQ